MQAYAYWKSGKINDVASFDLYFRKNPFKGEFTIFAGLSDCLKFLENFHYSETDINYLKTVLPSNVEQEFYDFLQQLTPREVTVAALAEGSVCFPRIPLMTITGPLIIVQLLETTFLTLVNYSSLITTNAARWGQKYLLKTLLAFKVPYCGWKGHQAAGVWVATCPGARWWALGFSIRLHRFVAWQG